MALLPAVSSDLARIWHLFDNIDLLSTICCTFPARSRNISRQSRACGRCIVHMRTGYLKVAVIRSREVAAKQGFLLYYNIPYGNAIAYRDQAIDRVAAYQGWPLREVPLYFH